MWLSFGQCPKFCFESKFFVNSISITQNRSWDVTLTTRECWSVLLAWSLAVNSAVFFRPVLCMTGLVYPTHLFTIKHNHCTTFVVIDHSIQINHRVRQRHLGDHECSIPSISLQEKHRIDIKRRTPLCMGTDIVSCPGVPLLYYRPNITSVLFIYVLQINILYSHLQRQH